MSQAPPPLDLPPLNLPPRPDQGEALAPRSSWRSCSSFLVAIVLGVLAVAVAPAGARRPRDLAAAVRRHPVVDPGRDPDAIPGAVADRADLPAEGRRRVPVPRAGRRRARPMEPVRPDHLRRQHGRRHLARAARPDAKPSPRDARDRDRVPVGRHDEGDVHPRVPADALRGRDPQGGAHLDLGRSRRLPRRSCGAWATLARRSRSPRRWPACSRDQDQYFGGIIVMDADATATRGFGYRYAHGSVLLHELGHIMGLDHVRDPDQLMYSGRHPNFGVSDFGAGRPRGAPAPRRWTPAASESTPVR